MSVGIDLPIAADGFKYGWQRDAENIEHYAGMWQPRTFQAPSDVPEVIDHRHWMDIENQGQMGSCAGHALAAVASICNWIKTGGDKVRMSRMWCYLMGQWLSGFFGADNGAAISGCVRAAHDLGVCPEEAFPYPGGYSITIPAGAKEIAAQHLVLSASPMNSYEDCFAFLAMLIGAIQIGINWTQSLAQDRTGVIEQVWGGSLGGHSLAFVGYSARRDSQGRKYLWMKNSHGRSWGNQGWAEVAPAVVDGWIRSRRSQGEFVGLSDMQEYRRRSINPANFV